MLCLRTRFLEDYDFKFLVLRRGFLQILPFPRLLLRFQVARPLRGGARAAVRGYDPRGQVSSAPACVLH